LGLEQPQQFGIFCFPNLVVWQLPKCFAKGKKDQSPIVCQISLANLKSWAHELGFCRGMKAFPREFLLASSRQNIAAISFVSRLLDGGRSFLAGLVSSLQSIAGTCVLPGGHQEVLGGNHIQVVVHRWYFSIAGTSPPCVSWFHLGAP